MGAMIGTTLSDRPAVSSEGIKADAACRSGLNMIAARLSPGAISDSSSSHLPPSVASLVFDHKRFRITENAVHMVMQKSWQFPTGCNARNLGISHLIPRRPINDDGVAIVRIKQVNPYRYPKNKKTNVNNHVANPNLIAKGDRHDAICKPRNLSTVSNLLRRFSNIKVDEIMEQNAPYCKQFQ